VKLPIGILVCKTCRQAYDSRTHAECPSKRCRGYRGETVRL
jgi:hypothetical protein